MEGHTDVEQNPGVKIEEVHSSSTLSLTSLDMFPRSAKTSFNTGLLENVENYFDILVNVLSKRLEIYYSPNLVFRPFEPHVSGIKLFVLNNGNVEFEKLLDEGTKVNNAITFGSGRQSENCYRLTSDLTSYKLSKARATPEKFYGLYLSDEFLLLGKEKAEIRIEVTISKFTQLWDVAILCEPETFPAHISILSQNSQVFAKMFETEMKELNDKCVRIRNVDAKVFREMLRFFYVSQVENMMEVGIELYELADQYMVENLKALCTRVLIRDMSKEHALEMYVFGREKELPEMTDKAECIMVENKGSLIKASEDLLDMMNSVPDSMAEDIFCLFVHGIKL